MISYFFERDGSVVFDFNRGEVMTRCQATRHLLYDRFSKANQQLNAHGLNIVTALTCCAPDLAQMKGDETIHYPPEDVLDSSTGGQYFLHQHHAKSVGETVHIHIFRRWCPPELNLKAGDTVLTHLAALVLTHDGQPKHWLAVNQWVVADYWQPADTTLALFRNWRVEHPDQGRGDQVPSICHEWLSSLVAYHLYFEIQELLMARDDQLDTLIDEYPGNNVLEEKLFEIVSVRPIAPASVTH